MSGYLVGAYLVFWAGAFLYLLSLGARRRSLERRLESLRALMEERETGDAHDRPADE